MFYKFLKIFIRYGKLEVVDYDNKTYTFGESEPFCSIKLHNKKIKNKLFFNPELHLGEAFVNRELTIEKGSLEDFINIISKNYSNINQSFFHYILNFFSSNKFRIFDKLNFVSRSIKNVEHHYDINVKVYEMFLDKDMQYSCGYFHNDNINLDQAQADKKQHIIKKLNIVNNKMKILDIGSGWGGLSLQIAKDTGATVKGITLSKEQLEYSKKRLNESDLNNLVEFEFKDYRELEGKFDRIVSVGMFEHVGVKQYNKFFSCIKNLLTDDGVMLLHSIGSKLESHKTNPWIEKYIFPGGYIPSLSEVVECVEKQGLWISDLEIWRLHYAKTLKHWRNNFNNNRQKISKMLDEGFCRMWEFYLLSSEYSFRNMGNMVFQMQISKNQESAPLTRNYIYN